MPVTWAIMIGSAGVSAITAYAVQRLIFGYRSALSQRIKRLTHRAHILNTQRKAIENINVRRMLPASVFGASIAAQACKISFINSMQSGLDRARLHVAAVDFLFAWIGGNLVLMLMLKYALELPTSAIAIIMIGVILWLPRIMLARRIRVQEQRFLHAFPAAVDMMVRSVKSGFPIAEAIQTVGDEGHGAVALTFREISGGMRLGLSLNEALTVAAQRVRISEFKFFVISLNIQQETGGNLAEILHGLGHMLRRRQQLRLKIKALSSEARASAMIIGALPFFMFFIIYVVNEKYIMKFFSDPRGTILLGIALSSMTLGAIVMKKMIRYDP